jgi:hypothetical protein
MDDRRESPIRVVIALAAALCVLTDLAVQVSIGPNRLVKNRCKIDCIIQPKGKEKVSKTDRQTDARRLTEKDREEEMRKKRKR